MSTFQKNHLFCDTLSHSAYVFMLLIFDAIATQFSLSIPLETLQNKAPWKLLISGEWTGFNTSMFSACRKVLWAALKVQISSQKFGFLKCNRAEMHMTCLLSVEGRLMSSFLSGALYAIPEVFFIVDQEMFCRFKEVGSFINSMILHLGLTMGWLPQADIVKRQLSSTVIK